MIRKIKDMIVKEIMEIALPYIHIHEDYIEFRTKIKELFK